MQLNIMTFLVCLCAILTFVLLNNLLRLSGSTEVFDFIGRITVGYFLFLFYGFILLNKD